VLIVGAAVAMVVSALGPWASAETFASGHESRSGLQVGLPALVGGVIAIVYVLRRPAVALVAAIVAVTWTLIAMREFPAGIADAWQWSPGWGAYLSLAIALMLAASGLRRTRRLVISRDRAGGPSRSTEPRRTS
jgi:hypothetical protein